MQLNHSAIKAGNLLKAGVDEGDWRAVARARERIAELLFAAVGAGSGETIQFLRNALAAARNEMVWKYRASVAEDPTAVSWMLEADARIADTAGRLRPAPPAYAPDTTDVRGRILDILNCTDQGLATQEIARRSGAALSTVARMLVRLRGEGLVVSRKVGRNVLSNLTPRGRAAARAGQAAQPFLRWDGRLDFVPGAVDEGDVNSAGELLEAKAPEGPVRDGLRIDSGVRPPNNPPVRAKELQY